MLTDIGVIGYPSRLGGADTELDHQIRCWQAMGVTVHLCHTGDLDDNLRSMNMAERGCVLHTPRDWKSLDGMDVISFCNDKYLESAKDIKKWARTSTFVPCMTWPFPKDIEATKRGFIDLHLFQTPWAQEKVSEKFAGVGRYKAVQFRPYFYAEDFPFVSQRDGAHFRFGRISRGDADKFAKSQLWIYETMTAPLLKSGMILGWDHRARAKFGRDPEGYIHTYAEGELSQREFYAFCDAVIMTTDTFENLPRVGFEAMASGSVLCVDDRGGWQALVEDGVTGWLCKDEREFVYKASRLAHEHEEREALREAAREKLQREWGLGSCQESWAHVFDEMEAAA